MPIATYFDDRMVCETGGFSPSGTKPKQVVEGWLECDAVAISSFSPATIEDLCLAHDRKYVAGIFAGTYANGHGNRSLAIANSTLWTVGSMVAAAQAAMDRGVACSPSSGFHHAHYECGGGFCTFNGLVVAARKLLNEGIAKRIGILDCDWHFGDGTDSILRHLRLRSQIQHRTSGSEQFSDEAEYQCWLEESLTSLWEFSVDLILYQAGADAHCNDPLGGLLQDETMALRDETVFDYCSAKKIPVAWNLAGGYQRSKDGEISKVIELHRRTMQECIAIYCPSDARSSGDSL